MNNIYLIIILSTLVLSCNNQELPDVSEKPMQISEIAHIVSPIGEKIIPIYSDTISFAGAPGYFAQVRNKRGIILVIGCCIQKGDNIEVKNISRFEYEINGQPQDVIIAVPKQEKYQSLKIENYDELNIDYMHFKLWLQDWFKYAYSGKNYKFLGWKNISQAQ